jgi:hypothetical protein
MKNLLLTFATLLLAAFATLASNNETFSANTLNDGVYLDEVYLVSVDILGNEDWVQMISTFTGSYQSFYDFIVDLTGSRAHFYFWADGKKYGAPAKDTPLVLGIALENELLPYDPSSGNELYYYTTDAGYSYMLEFIPRLNDDLELGSFYLSSARGGTVGLQTELGDVDLDHRVTISDVTVLIDYLLNNNLSYYVDKYNADVDQDGAINISDVTTLIDKLLGKEQPNEPYETPVPELTIVTDSVAEVVTFTATGEGTVFIYVNYFDGNGPQAVATGYGQATFEIPFGDEIVYVGVWVTAQADEDALVGKSETEYVEIPAKKGYWLVMVQADGTEEFVQLQLGANGDYVAAYDVVYPLYVNVGNFYFMIDGVPYGAPVDGTEAILGFADLNPLFANSSNTYYVYSGYSYVIAIHIVIDEATGEIAGYTAYVARGGYGSPF